VSSEGHWFEELADHMGEAYLRYSFTKGTVQEVEFLIRELDLGPSMSILDVGCGPGRHSLEFARRGFRVTGVDISETFISIAHAAAQRESLADAHFVVGDARESSSLATISAPFDRVVCLCQGAFGVMREDGHDEDVLRSIASVVKPGGRLALSAFNAYFSVRHHHEADFDAERGISHERTEINDGQGRVKEVSLWTGCYTPRELRLLLSVCGFRTHTIYGVEPGAYARREPSLDLAEFLVVAERV
jgi:SAM-dependent methyltransferase